MIKKILLFAVSAFILSAPLGVLAQVTTHGGGTGLIDVSSGSIPFGSVFNIRLATSSAFQFNNSASRLTVTYASTTGISTAYASSTNYLGANLATCTTTNALTWSAGFFGCVAIPQGTVTSVTATNPLFSTGGATPVISTIFGTTTTWGLGNNGVIMTGATGIPFSIATSSALALSITGNAATVTTNANLTGVVTSVGNATSIASSTIFAGVAGWLPYFSAANTLTSTSSIFLSTASFFGIASSTPFSRLSVGTGIASSSITVAEYKYGFNGNVATSTTMQVDCNASTQVAVPMGSGATTLTIVGMTPGKTCRVVVQNPSFAAGAITWAVPTGFILKWVGGTSPSQTTTANASDVWSFVATQGSSTIAIFGAASTGF